MLTGKASMHPAGRLPEDHPRRTILPRRDDPGVWHHATAAVSGHTTAGLRRVVPTHASGACFGDEAGETGTRCAIGNDRNASAAPATVSQCGCIVVSLRLTGHCGVTWRPSGRARTPWEGDVARLASPETGLLHSCCPNTRHSVCNRSSAGLRMMTNGFRPRVEVRHRSACRRSTSRD